MSINMIILGITIVGIVVILLVKNVEKITEKKESSIDKEVNKSKITEKTNNSESDKLKLDEQNKDKQIDDGKLDVQTTYMSLGMCFGIALSLIFKETLGSGYLSYGICFGMLGGMLIGMLAKKK